MSYFRKRGMGDNGDAPVIDLTTTEEPSSPPETQVVTEGGQVSPIPSSQPGGGSAGGQTAFVTVGGVCKPTNSASLANFKELQRQLNRVADVKSFPKIAPDGEIGSLTLALLSLVKNAASQTIVASGTTYGWRNFLMNQNVLNCNAVATSAITIAQMASAMADDLGASSSVSSPSPSKTPTYIDPITLQPQNQDIGASALDAFSNMSTGEKLALGAVVVGVGVVMFGSKGKKKKSGGRGRTFWGI